MSRRKLVLASPGMKELVIEVDDSDPTEKVRAEITRSWRVYHARNILPGSSDQTAGPERVFPLPRRWRDQLPRSILTWVVMGVALGFGLLCVLIISQGVEAP